jgi:hypothetical protein
MPGAQFLSCDQIMPFDRMTFGLIDPYDRGVRIFRVEKYVNPNDRIILAWKQSKSWLTGRYIMMEAKKNGTRRVAPCRRWAGIGPTTHTLKNTDSTNSNGTTSARMT